MLLDEYCVALVRTVTILENFQSEANSFLVVTQNCLCCCFTGCEWQDHTKGLKTTCVLCCWSKKFSSFVKIPFEKHPFALPCKALRADWRWQGRFAFLACFPLLMLSLAFCFKGMEGSLLEGSTLKYVSPTKKSNLPSLIYKSFLLHIRYVIVNRKHLFRCFPANDQVKVSFCH